MRRMTSNLIHLPHRSLLSLRGPDTIALLERLVTNATTDWEAGETRYGALLTPQGKVIADYLALRTEDGVWLDVSKAHIADLAKRLKMFRLRSDVEIEQRDDLFVFAGLDPCVERPETPDGATYAYRDPRYPEGRLRLTAGSMDVEDSSESLAKYHRDRIAHAVPEQGSDFGAAEVFPAEINMDVLDGVALNKGCFVGQEVVSRMHRRGKIRKRTLRLDLPETLQAASGDEIKAPLPIGAVTSTGTAQALAEPEIIRRQPVALIQPEQPAVQPFSFAQRPSLPFAILKPHLWPKPHALSPKPAQRVRRPGKPLS